MAHRPDRLGHFGDWGGRFVPEVLMAALDQLNDAFEDAITDPAFTAELAALRRDYAGRRRTADPPGWAFARHRAGSPRDGPRRP